MSEDEAQTRALLCCATAVASSQQREAVDAALAAVKDFRGFAERAEREGIAPLVAMQVAGLSRVPPEELAMLRGLVVRHKLASRARTRALEDAQRALDRAGIRALFTKGAALAWLAYPSPELRPMRDVDLLVEEATLDATADALKQAGFVDRHDAPAGCHEVYTVDRTVDGFRIRIDVHRRLGLFELPSYRASSRQTLPELFDSATPFRLGDVEARAPSRHDLLRIIHRHAFCLGLYEQHRLISVADLATAADRWATEVDWPRLQKEDPLTFAAVRVLPMAHRERGAGQPYEGFFSAGEPLRAGILTQLQAMRHRERRAAYFWGYDSGGFFVRLLATLAPPRWWLHMRHGRRSWLRHVADLAVVAWRRFSGRGNVRR